MAGGWGLRGLAAIAGGAEGDDGEGLAGKTGECPKYFLCSRVGISGDD